MDKVLCAQSVSLLNPWGSGLAHPWTFWSALCWWYTWLVSFQSWKSDTCLLLSAWLHLAPFLWTCSDFMAKSSGYGLKKPWQHQQWSVSLPLEPWRSSSSVTSQQEVWWIGDAEISVVTLEQLHKRYRRNEVLMKMSNTRSGLNNWTERRKIFSVVTCFSEMSAIYFSVFICQCVRQCICPFVSVCVPALGRSFCDENRRMKISTEKSAVTKGHSVASWKPECFFPKEVVSFGDPHPVPCGLVPLGCWAWCGSCLGFCPAIPALPLPSPVTCGLSGSLNFV